MLKCYCDQASGHLCEGSTDSHIIMAEPIIKQSLPDSHLESSWGL